MENRRRRPTLRLVDQRSTRDVIVGRGDCDIGLWRTGDVGDDTRSIKGK